MTPESFLHIHILREIETIYKNNGGQKSCDTGSLTIASYLFYCEKNERLDNKGKEEKSLDVEAEACGWMWPRNCWY